MAEMITVIETRGTGGPDVLALAERTRPEPGEGEVLIKVAAAGVNRPDILQRQGLYPPPPDASDLLGLEVAGEVVGLGPGTARYREGDLVCALVNGGGYAEYCVAPEATTLPVPKGLSLEEAAVLPEAAFTVWHNVFERAHLQPKDWLLVHGGASGIGTTAIQMATAFGAKVIVTAGGEVKCRACEKLGAVAAIDYWREDFVARVRDITGKRGVDVVLDMVGGEYVERNLKCMATEGRIVQIAFLKGSKIEIDLMRLMLKRLTLTGSTLRSQGPEAKARIAQALEARIWPLIEAGRIRPLIDSQFFLWDAASAHGYLDEGRHIGKVVLRTGVAEDS